eukprot:GHVP01012604.1.p1 GENE.GHVP01012604.1~~GHVP01012604.1.p1  ORF type:complete len:288 (+),score=19.42 GHVP01012604.1:76-864(+)
MPAEPATNLTEVIDWLAKTLFGNRRDALTRLVDQLNRPERRRTVREANRHFRTTVAAYLYITRRLGISSRFQPDTLRVSYLHCLPENIHRIMANNTMNLASMTVQALGAHALGVEEQLQNLYNTDEELNHQEVPSGDRSIQYKNPEVNDQPMVDIKPRTPCPSCGGEHWRRDCPHASHRCEKCKGLGHLPSHCRTTIITENGRETGRVLRQGRKLRFEVREGATVAQTKKDFEAWLRREVKRDEAPRTRRPKEANKGNKGSK